MEQSKHLKNRQYYCIKKVTRLRKVSYVNLIGNCTDYSDAYKHIETKLPYYRCSYIVAKREMITNQGE